MNENELTPHSLKQDAALFCETRFLATLTGTQWGKGSGVGAPRMAMKMHTFTAKDDHFLITAPTYKILTQATLIPFLAIMRERGTYNKAEQMFEMHGGGRCFFRTETDPDSVVGITNIRHVWADEAGKYRRYFWDNLRARMDSKGGSGDLTTSPYSLNWVYTDIVKPYRAGTLGPDWTVIQAASWENPFHFLHNPVERAKARATMDPRRFKMIYGGEFGRMEGLVYDCWEDEENLVDAFPFPPGTRFFGGIDWGYHPDPWVLKIRALLPDGSQVGFSEYVKTKDTITDIVRVCQEKRTVWPIELFIADPSQPGYIEEMNRGKLPTIGATNDIRLGIDEHYNLIKTRRYKEVRGACPHSCDEREQYHYPEPKDLKPDEDKREILPVDQFNHCFPVGTVIETTRGQVPIEEVGRGDLVYTRSGPRRVVDQWCEGERELVKIGAVTCTPEHKIYTKNRAFVRADSLTDADDLVTWESWKKQSSSWVRRTNSTVASDTLVAGLAACMWLFGSIIMAPCLRAFTFITGMETPRITGSRTWNWFTARLTSLITRVSGSATPCYSPNSASTLSVSALSLRHGIAPLRALSGTEIMSARFGLIRKADQWKSHVYTAAKAFRRFTWPLPVPATARTTVRQRLAGRLASITRLGRVLFADRALRSVNTRPPSRVLMPVAGNTVALPAGRGVVYNLTVEGAFEYFAGGILVSNCMDTDRYLTMHLKNLTMGKNPKVPVGSRKRMTESEFIRRPSHTPQTETWSKD